VIEGIGASFDTPEHDVQIAQAGRAALTRKYRDDFMHANSADKRAIDSILYLFLPVCGSAHRQGRTGLLGIAA
jgi:hypothetical protein